MTCESACQRSQVCVSSSFKINLVQGQSMSAILLCSIYNYVILGVILLLDSKNFCIRSYTTYIFLSCDNFINYKFNNFCT